MPTKTINNASFHYQERGHGTAVVLVHAFPVDSRMWDAQIADLSDRYRVIAPDLRGFGQTTSTASYTIASLADDLHVLLKTINALPCVLAGVSWGGYIGLAFARKYSQDLLGLGLIDTRSEPDSAEAKENRNKLIATVREKGAKAIADAMVPKLLGERTSKHRLDIVQKVRHMIEPLPAKSIENGLVALRDREDSTSVLPEIRVPTLIMVGEQDTITPPPLSQAMSKLVRNPTLVVVPGSGHLPPIEQPDEVTVTMRRFLEAATMSR